MAKLSIIEREKKRTLLVQKYASKRDALRAVIKDPKSTAEQRWEAQVGLQKLPKNSAPARQVNRCHLTGRPHGVYRKFGLSRSMIRKYAMQGDVPGLKKASW